LTEREHTGKKIVDCQIIGPAAAGSAGYVASSMEKCEWVSEWVSSFLMAHQHKKAILVSFMVYTIDQIWKSLIKGKTDECKS